MIELDLTGQEGKERFLITLANACVCLKMPIVRSYAEVIKKTNRVNFFRE